MTLVVPIVTGLVAGFAHALEPDHLAAVTAFVATRPDPLRAVGFGVRWAIGHGLTLLVACLLLGLLDLRPSPPVARALEVGVGAMLVGVGAWLLRARAPAHDHAGHRGPLLVGAAHGLAGSGPLVAVLPVAVLASPWLSGGYLVAFGVGNVLAMGTYALLAGSALQRVGVAAPRALRAAAAVASIAVGVVWASRAWVVG